MSLTESEKKKAVGQFKMAGRGIMQVFNELGHQIYIADAIEMWAENALLLHKRLKGESVPISYAHVKGKYYQRMNGKK